VRTIDRSEGSNELMPMAAGRGGRTRSTRAAPMPVARAWSLDAARRARLGFSGSKTKLAFRKSNVRASCAEAQQHATRQFTCLHMGKQSE
jgi:hypothetical protein